MHAAVDSANYACIEPFAHRDFLIVASGKICWVLTVISVVNCLHIFICNSAW